MKAWCNRCNTYVNCTNRFEHIREQSIRDVSFKAVEYYGTCPVCGNVVFTAEMIDDNVRIANTAFRHSIGSISKDEIQELLEMYEIGAQPLSILLGWGQNTIERQMKHTIPSREHARRLRDLKDPDLMLMLLKERGHLITDVAYRKAYNAASRQKKSGFSLFKLYEEATMHFRIKHQDGRMVQGSFRDNELQKQEQYRIIFATVGGHNNG